MALFMLRFQQLGCGIHLFHFVFQAILLHFHSVLVLVSLFALAQDCRLSWEYNSANRMCFHSGLFIYSYHIIISQKANQKTSNILDYLFKIKKYRYPVKNRGLHHLSTGVCSHLEHEEGDMIRLSILESKKQWDLIGKFFKLIGIFQYIDLFQSKMNGLFYSLLIHYQKKKKSKCFVLLKAP